MSNVVFEELPSPDRSPLYAHLLTLLFPTHLLSVTIYVKLLEKPPDHDGGFLGPTKGSREGAQEPGKG